MKNLKISILVIAGIIYQGLIYAQTNVNKDTDLFCQMVRTNYFIDAMNFKSELIKKNIFETDTTVTYADITLIKNGNKISYLYINPENDEKELIFYHDSAWVADHHLEKLICIGKDIKDLTHNEMAQFFSFTIFDIDTLIEKTDPYWHVISQNDISTTISVTMNSDSKDLSGLRAEYETGNTDHLLYRTIQEVTYMKADQIYQEQVFSDYKFPDPADINPPEYLSIYERDLSRFLVQDSTVQPEPEPNVSDIFLDNIKLTDLQGNKYQLPGDGIIFFDLWYVGCAPCMRSAPVIDELYRTYGERIYFYSVNEVDRDTTKISFFIKKMGIGFPVLLGGEEKLAPKVSFSGGYPVFFMMDAETGKVLWSMSGYTENLRDVIEEAILKNLQ